MISRQFECIFYFVSCPTRTLSPSPISILPYDTQLLQELREKQNQEATLQEELERLKESLRNEKDSNSKITFERDRLISLCDEKDSALLVSNFII